MKESGTISRTILFTGVFVFLNLLNCGILVILLLYLGMGAIIPFIALMVFLMFLFFPMYRKICQENISFIKTVILGYISYVSTISIYIIFVNMFRDIFYTGFGVRELIFEVLGSALIPFIVLMVIYPIYNEFIKK